MRVLRAGSAEANKETHDAAIPRPSYFVLSPQPEALCASRRGGKQTGSRRKRRSGARALVRQAHRLRSGAGRARRSDGQRPHPQRRRPPQPLCYSE